MFSSSGLPCSSRQLWPPSLPTFLCLLNVRKALQELVIWPIVVSSTYVPGTGKCRIAKGSSWGLSSAPPSPPTSFFLGLLCASHSRLLCYGDRPGKPIPHYGWHSQVLFPFLRDTSSPHLHLAPILYLVLSIDTTSQGSFPGPAQQGKDSHSTFPEFITAVFSILWVTTALQSCSCHWYVLLWVLLQSWASVCVELWSLLAHPWQTSLASGWINSAICGQG